MNSIKLPKNDQCSVAIIGLGYVGLPLALSIAKRKNCLLTKRPLTREVIGFDINELRINELLKGFDRNNIISGKELKKVKNIQFTTKNNMLKDVDVYIVTVPTPIDKEKKPDYLILINYEKLSSEFNLDEFKILHQFKDCYFLKYND